MLDCEDCNYFKICGYHAECSYYGITLSALVDIDCEFKKEV